MTSRHPLAQDLAEATHRAEADLRALGGGRVFITGGTGFVGTWLLELLATGARLLNLDLRATVLTRHPKAWSARLPHLASSPAVTLVAGDVRTFHFPAGEFAAVILGAASSDNAWTSAHPREVAETIEGGTRRSLAFADSSGAVRALLLSSGAVYGTQPAGLAAIPESYTGVPSFGDAYGLAKRAAEDITAQWSVGAHKAVIARIFSVYGPYQPLDTHFAIGNFLADALAGRPITVQGDGSAVRSYLYGADLAVALIACLVRGEPGRRYNLGGDEPIQLGELAALIAGVAPAPVGVRILGQASSSARYVPDVRRIARELAFEPAVSLTEGLRRTIAFASERTGPSDPSVPGSPA